MTGVLGWPVLTDWPGGIVPPVMDKVGANLTYGIANFSKFLDITFYNDSKLVANLTHFDEGYKVVVTCENCEETKVQLHIPSEGKYKMCYNFSNDVQWTVQSHPPPGYEVPNCTQYTQAPPMESK